MKLSEKKKKNDLDEHADKDAMWWKNIIFLDESEYNVFRFGERIMVQTKINKKLKCCNS